MPALIITDEKPAAGTNRGELEFVWTTTAPSHGKDDTDVNIRHHAAPFKSR